MKILKTMNAHKVEIILTENGTLTLQGLPFQAGEAVEVIILSSQSEPEKAFVPPSNLMPLRGTVKSYDEPFEPRVSASNFVAEDTDYLAQL
jgi:hypothetical protein